MSVDQIYQDAILKQAKSGVGAGRLNDASASATVDNPLCGDRVTVDLRVEDGTITAVGHRVRGCLLCEASAAILARHMVGQTADRTGAIADRVDRMVRQDGDPPDGWDALSIFDPVKPVKSRHECVLLPFRAAAEAAGKAGGT